MFPRTPPRLHALQPLLLPNLTCPYCASPLTRRTRTKEHVIGRCFVPKGTLDGCWNLLLWACSGCNGHKSDLEDDISAITMQARTSVVHSPVDAHFQREATRKSAKSISRKTGKPVAKSSQTLTVRAPIGAMGTLTGSFTGPPQIDDNRAYELARLQMLGFFYFLTYNDTENVGLCWPGGFFPVHGTVKSDWGNPVHRAFIEEVCEWDYRLHLTTAAGYYRAMIRRHPSAECWSWAVEWNDSYRLVGFFGGLEAAKAIADRLPDMPVDSLVESANRWVRYRVETSIPENEDKLFIIPAKKDA